MKIIELLIDELDKLSGVDAVALVEEPAIEADFFAFNEADIDDTILFNLIKNEVLSQFDETEDVYEIKIGDYQTRHYDMCPAASALYKQIESGDIDVDMGLAIRAARLQDSLFYLEKHTIKEMGSASFEDVVSAQNIVSEIMELARMMGLEEEHQYVYGHLQAIRDLYEGKEENSAETQAFSGKTAKFTFAMDEDQQIVVGPLMIPEKLILRVDEDNDPYYVFFSEETVKKIAYKLMKEKNLDALNIEHNPDNLVEGHMLETWLVEDPLKDKQQVYGFNFPKGTWMGQYKVEDLSTWNKIKAGDIKGFSVEGFFKDKYIQASKA